EPDDNPMMSPDDLGGVGAGAGEGQAQPSEGALGDEYGDDERGPRRGVEKDPGSGDVEPPVDLGSLGVGGRLNVAGQDVQLDVPPSREGAGSGRFSLVPADVSSGSVNLGQSDAGNDSTEAITTSGDPNSVPWRLRSYIRDYFSQLSGK